jgi:spore coat polysaccharide biosynthesis predicted glycosyltransferase SpsG
VKVLYRADGGNLLGTGHVLRATRVLRAWQHEEDVQATLLIRQEPSIERLAAAWPGAVQWLAPGSHPGDGRPHLDGEPVADAIRRLQPDVVVVDMLDTSDEAMAAIESTGCAIVTYDDRGQGRLRASTIINILVREPEPAHLPGSIRLLEGPQYATLDDVYSRRRGAAAARPAGRLDRVLVTLGGADGAGLSVKVARSLMRLEWLKRVDFATGAAFQQEEALRRVLEQAPWSACIHKALPNLCDLYCEADLCIVAGGLTMYEVCCVGAPALAVCQPIDHQLELAQLLSDAGAMATVGYGTEASEEQIAEAVAKLAPPMVRHAMSQAGPELVDGRGTERNVAAIRAAARGGQGE